MLNPQICGEWDGCSVWLQWEDPGASKGDLAYQIRLRYRQTKNDPWQDWMYVVPRQGEHSHWAVIPTWREGWFVQAQIRVKPHPDGAEEGATFKWELAQEVTFRRCSALFQFETEKYYQHFRKDHIFHCQVDAAACAYQLTHDIEVKVGEPTLARMEAMGESGYHQLDYPSHFELHPGLGVQIWNVAPSEEDVELTGRDLTEVKPKEQLDPITVAVTPRRSF